MKFTSENRPRSNQKSSLAATQLGSSRYRRPDLTSGSDGPSSGRSATAGASPADPAVCVQSTAKTTVPAIVNSRFGAGPDWMSIKLVFSFDANANAAARFADRHADGIAFCAGARYFRPFSDQKI